MEDNYDDEEEEGEDVPITTTTNNNKDAANTVANKQPTVPTVEMKKVVQPTTAIGGSASDKVGDVFVHHHPSMKPGRILRFTELMHPQKSLEEEREVARERRRQRKKEREEEEGEEGEATRRLEGENDDAREETDDSEEEEEEGDNSMEGDSDNEDLHGFHYRGEKLLPKVNQVMLDQDLNDDIDRKWRPGGRVDRDDVSLAARVAEMYASEKEAMREAMADALDIDEIKKIKVTELEKEKFLVGVEQKDWEDDIMWDDEGGAADEEQRRRTAGSATFQASAAEREQKEGIAVVGIAEKEKDKQGC